MDSKAMLLFIILFPLAGAFVGYILGIKGERWRDIFNIFMTGITFIVVILLFPYIKQGDIEVYVPNIMGTGIHLMLNAFRYIFVFITAFVWLLTTIYSNKYLIKHKNRNRYYLFFMLTLWSTMGIFVSENFINLFTFFEIMSFTSYALVIHDEDEYSHEAGNTYIIMAVTGGLILLMGLFLLYDYTNTLDITAVQGAIEGIGNIKYFIVSLIIIGFGVKASMVPLHIWLPKAYPAAPAPATAVLSAILAKTGIFGIMITIEIIMKNDLKVATVILLLGFVNMFLGGFLAMFQRNIKRILAYSSMSQIGYILLGVGLTGVLKEHGALALYGTLYHVVNHALFKALLFMIAGIIYMNAHELSINKIGGFGRSNVVLKGLFLVGLFGITGMPGFNGFISKNLIHHALSESYHIYSGPLPIIFEVIFTLSSSFTVAYLLKIFVAVFIDKGEGEARSGRNNISLGSIVPMGILAVSIIYIGIKPGSIMGILNKAIASFGIDSANVHFYTFTNIKSSLISMILGIIIYIYFIRRYIRVSDGNSYIYKNVTLSWFSIEKDIYNPLFKVMFNTSYVLLKAIDQSLVRGVVLLGNGLSFIGNIELRKRKELNTKLRSLKPTFYKDEKYERIDILEETKDVQVSTQYLSEKLEELSKSFNSVTSSIFLFGTVLVICLIIMMS